MKERRYDIDWLRVIAMLAVFIFHCTRFFCTVDWHLKVPASQQSEALNLVRGFLFNTWFMELFVLVSGFAAWYALRRRTGGQYLVERVKRILIPLYTVGLFILVVPQQYFEYYSHGKVTTTFWQWLPGYYLGLPATLFNLAGHNFADPVQVLLYSFSGHLWFIQMLFLITLLTLPLLLYLRSSRGQRLIARLAGWSARLDPDPVRGIRPTHRFHALPVWHDAAKEATRCARRMTTTTRKVRAILELYASALSKEARHDR